MGKSIGLDFGTTYSLAAIPKDAANGNYEPEAVKLAQSGEDIRPTIVLLDRRGVWHFGTDAKDQMGKTDVNTYEGFKLLLDESDPELLRKRGYCRLGEQDRPEEITKRFLEDFLGIVRNRIEDDIDRIVVGVPEIWIEEIETKKYEILEGIIDGIDVANAIETTISEPQCACAYYAKKYKEKKGKTFQGRILLIDYGGGTLDIALCDVKGNDEIDKDKITVLARNGKGKNKFGEVGAAGLRYMEEVVRLALNQQGIDEVDIDNNKTVFYDCLSSVEKDFFGLENRSKENIRWVNFYEVFDQDSLKSISKKYSDSNNQDHFFAEIEGYFKIKGEIKHVIAPVTYGLVAQAYIDVIQKPLNEALEEIADKIDELNIKYKKNNERIINYKGETIDDDFKIQMIGGFSKFYLVEKQIKENKRIGGDPNLDKRYLDGLETVVEKERAVAYGAALFANDIYEAGTTAPYSLGIWGAFNGVWVPFWAINIHDEVEYDRMYLFRVNEETLPNVKYDTVIHIHGSELQKFAVKREFGIVDIIEPKEKYKKQLLLNDSIEYVMGISIDKSRRISLHQWAITDMEKHKSLRSNISLFENMINSGDNVPGHEYKGNAKLSTIYDISTTPTVGLI